MGVGLLMGLVGAEIGLRLLGIEPERYPPPLWLGWDGDRFRPLAEFGGWGNGVYKNHSRFANLGVDGGEHIAGTRFRVEYATNPRGYFDEGRGITYEINRQGLHGPEVAEVKPAGTFRILGIGDSFTFGQGVCEEDTFLRRLDRSLNANGSSGHRYEVLNAGVQGYDTHDEVVHLEHQWLAYDPDLVLIGFYLNDAYEEMTFWNHGGGLGIYALPKGLARYSRLYDLIRQRQIALDSQRKLEEIYEQPYFTQADEFFAHSSSRQQGWTKGRAALRRAAELSQNDGFSLVLVIFPELHNLDGDYPFSAVHQVVRQEAAEAGMLVLDLLETYGGHDDRSLWVHPSDHHPNERAHALAADAIETFLFERQLLPDSAK